MDPARPFPPDAETGAPPPAALPDGSPGDVTDNTLLGGRVRLRQPAGGYRAAIDPVLLAAALAPGPGQRVLDAGAGVGAAALCLAARRPDCRIAALELQPALAELARQGVALNGAEGRVTVAEGALQAPPADLGGPFDHVMTNPPFHQAGSLSPHAGKALANHESGLDLAGWLRLCLGLLVPKGSLVVIHRADRLDEILAALRGPAPLQAAGDIAVLPLWPKAGRPARRVLVRARKGLRSPARLLPGLLLHAEDGGYTAAAEAVLRHGAGLDWT